MHCVQCTTHAVRITAISALNLAPVESVETAQKGFGSHPKNKTSHKLFRTLFVPDTPLALLGPLLGPRLVACHQYPCPHIRGSVRATLFGAPSVGNHGQNLRFMVGKHLRKDQNSPPPAPLCHVSASAPQQGQVQNQVTCSYLVIRRSWGSSILV